MTSNGVLASVVAEEPDGLDRGLGSMLGELLGYELFAMVNSVSDSAS